MHHLWSDSNGTGDVKIEDVGRKFSIIKEVYESKKDKRNSSLDITYIKELEPWFEDANGLRGSWGPHRLHLTLKRHFIHSP